MWVNYEFLHFLNIDSIYIASIILSFIAFYLVFKGGKFFANNKKQVKLIKTHLFENFN